MTVVTDPAATADAAAATPATSLLELDGVHTYYGRIHALQGVDLDGPRGEIVTLIGSNGAGKTTTLKTISGLLHPRDGHGHVRRARTSRKTAPHELVRAGHRPRARRAGGSSPG